MHPSDKVRINSALGRNELFLNLAEGIGRVDAIDHHGNRRIRAAELLG